MNLILAIALVGLCAYVFWPGLSDLAIYSQYWEPSEDFENDETLGK